MSTATTTSTPTLTLRPDNLKRIDLSNFEARPGNDFSSAFTAFDEPLEGDQADYLPQRFAELKQELVQNPEKVVESWKRLKLVLGDKIKLIEQEGSNIIPEISFNEIQKLDPAKRQNILEKGCVIIRNVFPKEKALEFKKDAQEYIKLNPQTKGYPASDPIVYELYWSKSQVNARSDPKMMETMKFINNLWHTNDPNVEVSLNHNLSYADRFRIRNPGDDSFTLGPHADGGCIERWEDEEYRKCYKDVFNGDWENYDSYDVTHRTKANMNIYPVANACSVFRSFQGWLSMSSVGPSEGTILLAPFIKEITSYFLLKPFFDEFDELDLQSSKFPGSKLGKNQEFNEKSHPDLNLSKLMTSIPKVQPGDAVFWHCDLIHAVDPVHKGELDSSVMYIPAVPLCDLNTKYLKLQREALLKGLTGPDFPGFPTSEAETNHQNRADSKFVYQVGGLQALQELGLEPIKYDENDSQGVKAVIDNFNKELFYKV
ncbi:hypothetical protein BN7_4679 [Wickerhamomyces ciferrii]|uniref:DUF1479-domain-containing protein n=1 Tax=Wickerhamomyces ciferrii (strain ATCC 14091 / BCRC 22168 / CBS 111 / JCM 3599 / NBRC 0793 / NRRL Y-1031 F-60-10) TaxID=1206466 RepID=K0KPZ3_WICCF|nr:uncharacterized protein BN7_4679 [Wickerhamomyces ciferrii]CCH45101.1 hypothetical protein BN7_4679 [Wickerhamomyces ciferrii]